MPSFSPLPPLSSHLNRFDVYETAARVYVVGHDDVAQTSRILKFHRNSGNVLAMESDDSVLTAPQLTTLLASVQDGNVNAGGLQHRLTALGILGAVQFTSRWYLFLVTAAEPVAMVGSHIIHRISATELYPLSPPQQTAATTPSGNQPAPTALGPGRSRARLVDDSRDEVRFRDLFLTFEFSSFAFFSRTLDLSNTLQRLALRKRSRPVFWWNRSMMTAIADSDPTPRAQPFGAPATSADCASTVGAAVVHHWCIGVISGFVGMASTDVRGRVVRLVVIARRHAEYAGTRYRKRGINCDGAVANAAEIEQILWDNTALALGPGVSGGTDKDIENLRSLHSPRGCMSYGRWASFVQYRGSVPLRWGHSPAKGAPGAALGVKAKPDIWLGPRTEATLLHFRRLLSVYGAPVVCLDVLKRRASERVPREAPLGDAYAHVASELQRSGLPLIYLPWDFRAAVQSNNSDLVLEELSCIAEGATRATAIFYCDAAGIKSLQRGILRTNCVDCLDRTNIAQFVIARHLLGVLCSVLRLCSPEDVPSSLNVQLLTLFLQLGDNIAHLYAGSSTVSAGYMHRGAAWDFVTSFKRIYSNSFLDADKQAAINLFLGAYKANLSCDHILLNYHTWPMHDDRNCDGNAPPGQERAASRKMKDAFTAFGNIFGMKSKLAPPVPVAEKHTHFPPSVEVLPDSIDPQSQCVRVQDIWNIDADDYFTQSDTMFAANRRAGKLHGRKCIENSHFLQDDEPITHIIERCDSQELLPSETVTTSIPHPFPLSSAVSTIAASSMQFSPLAVSAVSPAMGTAKSPPIRPRPIPRFGTLLGLDQRPSQMPDNHAISFTSLGTFAEQGVGPVPSIMSHIPRPPDEVPRSRCPLAPRKEAVLDTPELVRSWITANSGMEDDVNSLDGFESVPLACSHCESADRKTPRTSPVPPSCSTSVRFPETVSEEGVERVLLPVEAASEVPPELPNSPTLNPFITRSLRADPPVCSSQFRRVLDSTHGGDAYVDFTYLKVETTPETLASAMSGSSGDANFEAAAWSPPFSTTVAPSRDTRDPADGSDAVTSTSRCSVCRDFERDRIMSDHTRSEVVDEMKVSQVHRPPLTPFSMFQSATTCGFELAPSQCSINAAGFRSQGPDSSRSIEAFNKYAKGSGFVNPFNFSHVMGPDFDSKEVGTPVSLAPDRTTEAVKNHSQDLIDRILASATAGHVVFTGSVAAAKSASGASRTRRVPTPDPMYPTIVSTPASDPRGEYLLAVPPVTLARSRSPSPPLDISPKGQTARKAALRATPGIWPVTNMNTGEEATESGEVDSYGRFVFGHAALLAKWAQIGKNSVSSSRRMSVENSMGLTTPATPSAYDVAASVYTTASYLVENTDSTHYRNYFTENPPVPPSAPTVVYSVLSLVREMERLIVARVHNLHLTIPVLRLDSCASKVMNQSSNASLNSISSSWLHSPLSQSQPKDDLYGDAWPTRRYFVPPIYPLPPPQERPGTSTAFSEGVLQMFCSATDLTPDVLANAGLSAPGLCHSLKLLIILIMDPVGGVRRMNRVRPAVVTGSGGPTTDSAAAGGNSQKTMSLHGILKSAVLRRCFAAATLVSYVYDLLDICHQSVIFVKGTKLAPDVQLPSLLSGKKFTGVHGGAAVIIPGRWALAFNANHWSSPIPIGFDTVTWMAALWSVCRMFHYKSHATPSQALNLDKPGLVGPSDTPRQRQCVVIILRVLCNLKAFFPVATVSSGVSRDFCDNLSLWRFHLEPYRRTLNSTCESGGRRRARHTTQSLVDSSPLTVSSPSVPLKLKSILDDPIAMSFFNAPGETQVLNSQGMSSQTNSPLVVAQDLVYKVFTVFAESVGRASSSGRQVSVSDHLPDVGHSEFSDLLFPPSSLSSYRQMLDCAACLWNVDPLLLPEGCDYFCFWVNVFNAMYMHSLLSLPRGPLSILPLTSELYFNWTTRMGYVVGGHFFSMSDIRHGILRGNRRPPGTLFRPFPFPCDPRRRFVRSPDAHSSASAADPMFQATKRPQGDAADLFMPDGFEVRSDLSLHFVTVDLGCRCISTDPVASHLADGVDYRTRRGPDGITFVKSHNYSALSVLHVLCPSVVTLSHLTPGAGAPSLLGVLMERILPLWTTYAYFSSIAALYCESGIYIAQKDKRCEVAVVLPGVLATFPDDFGSTRQSICRNVLRLLSRDRRPPLAEYINHANAVILFSD